MTSTPTIEHDELRVLGRLYSYKQAAKILGVRPQTLRLWASQGKVTRVYLGRAVRVSEASLHDLVARGFSKSTE